MLKITSILYRTYILIILISYGLLMMAASNGGYGNSDLDTIEIAVLLSMTVVFVTLTLFSNTKDSKAKNSYRYISAAIVLLLFIAFCVMLIMTKPDAVLFVIFLLFGTLSVTLSYQLICYKLPEN